MEEGAPKEQRQEEQGGGKVHLPLVLASYGMVHAQTVLMTPGQRAEGGTAEDKASLYHKLCHLCRRCCFNCCPHFQALFVTIGTALHGEDKEEWWCKPAHIWAYLLACVAGPFYLDTGQLSHFITKFLLIYLHMFIIFICPSIIPKNPVSCHFIMVTLLWGTPWLPWGHRGPIFQRCSKVKMKVRNRHRQTAMRQKLKAHLFALTIASLKKLCWLVPLRPLPPTSCSVWCTARHPWQPKEQPGPIHF